MIIMACRSHGFPGPSTATRPYCPSLSVGLSCYILYPDLYIFTYTYILKKLLIYA